jgi:hypothetical protein
MRNPVGFFSKQPLLNYSSIKTMPDGRKREKGVFSL